MHIDVDLPVIQTYGYDVSLTEALSARYAVLTSLFTKAQDIFQRVKRGTIRLGMVPRPIALILTTGDSNNPEHVMRLFNLLCELDPQQDMDGSSRGSRLMSIFDCDSAVYWIENAPVLLEWINSTGVWEGGERA